MNRLTNRAYRGSGLAQRTIATPGYAPPARAKAAPFPTPDDDQPASKPLHKTGDTQRDEDKDIDGLDYLVPFSNLG